MARLDSVQLHALDATVSSIHQSAAVHYFENALQSLLHGFARQRLLLCSHIQQLLAEMSVAMVPARKLHVAVVASGRLTSTCLALHVVMLRHQVVIAGVALK